MNFSEHSVYKMRTWVKCAFAKYNNWGLCTYNIYDFDNIIKWLMRFSSFKSTPVITCFFTCRIGVDTNVNLNNNKKATFIYLCCISYMAQFCSQSKTLRLKQRSLVPDCGGDLGEIRICPVILFCSDFLRLRFCWVSVQKIHWHTALALRKKEKLLKHF